jgi:hypothetical protein
VISVTVVRRKGGLGAGRTPVSARLASGSASAAERPRPIQISETGARIRHSASLGGSPAAAAIRSARGSFSLTTSALEIE